MTRLEDRRTLVDHITQARAEGARLRSACAAAGIDVRTLQRWKSGKGLMRGDRRPDADHPVPSHALSEAEQARIVAVCNEPRFAEAPPARVVPRLADEGIYIASESSFYRVLRAHNQMNRRGRARTAARVSARTYLPYLRGQRFMGHPPTTRPYRQRAAEAWQRLLTGRTSLAAHPASPPNARNWPKLS